MKRGGVEKRGRKRSLGPMLMPDNGMLELANALGVTVDLLGKE